MLTRLRVDGFKNLVDVDVRFGPFTCIAGANGVGKSNLFDAILFLSALADKTLTEAALSVRIAGDLGGDPLGIFYGGGGDSDARLRLTAEMIISQTATDDLGQTAHAATTFVEYEIELGIRPQTVERPGADIMILREALRPIRLGDAQERLRFAHEPAWRRSALVGRRVVDFISTEEVRGVTQIKRHQDGNSGRAAQLAATSLPRTVLSSATASESPTALVARREMQSWRLLQLEPTHLREPAEYHAPDRLDASGRYLPALLHRLDRGDLPEEPGATLATLANRLSRLASETRELEIDRDDARRRTTVFVHDGSGGKYPARALSDGTLRFLALLALDLDPEAYGLICLEEPENGIHPELVTRMLELLQGMATDVTAAMGPDNSPRQVIINTHSPLVVAATAVDDLIVVDLKPVERGSGVVRVPRFMVGAGSWRAAAGAREIARHILMRYIGAAPRERSETRDQSSIKPVAIVSEAYLPHTLFEHP